MTVLSLTVVFISISAVIGYHVDVLSLPVDPKLSYLDGNSMFPQTFNPAYVEPSPGTNNKKGLLVRAQNCSQFTPGQCIFCNVNNDHPIAPYFPGSILAFAELREDGSFKAPYKVFAPDPTQPENYGTEDPRLTYDPSTQLYHLFYTCYSGTTGARLCHAITKNPTAPYPGNWTRLGVVFDIDGSKSGALLIRPSPPHYLYWGAGVIGLAISNDLKTWTNINRTFLLPRQNSFDNVGVESGPSPQLLSNGNYIFFHNSWNSTNNCYHPTYAIINGTDPTKLIHRSSSPMLSPIFGWQLGTAPFECNVQCVVFLEAVAPVQGQVDTFDVWFGGSDAVIGTARVKVYVP
eukprot:PhF_6_TR8638/c0_g1_i2/m.13492/K20885/K20885; beta-1,2-mannobiose phosphorylase / 1,2-beta-oligomannan phosphorylase